MSHHPLNPPSLAVVCCKFVVASPGATTMHFTLLPRASSLAASAWVNTALAAQRTRQVTGSVHYAFPRGAAHPA